MKFKLLEQLLIEDDEENPETLDNLIKKIDDPGTSNLDKAVLAEKYLELKYDNSALKQIESAKPTILDSIVDIGIQNNKLLQLVDNFLEKLPSNFLLYESYLKLYNKFLEDNVIAVNDPWIYQDWVYNENEKANIYKIKACIFLSDANNLRKYGLYKKDKDGNLTKDFISIEDIENKSAQEIMSFLNNVQTESGEDNDLREIFRLNGLKDKKDRINFIVKLYEQEGKDKQDQILKDLTKLLEDKSNYNEFLDLEILGWEKGKDDKIKPVIDEFIKSSSNVKGTKEESPTEITLNQHLNNLKINDKLKYIMDLFAGSSSKILKTIELKLNKIFNNKNKLSKLLKLNLPNYNSKNTKAIKKAITTYLNNLDIEGNPMPPIWQDIKKWRNTKEFKQAVSPNKNSIDNLKSAFNDVYKKGMDINILKNKIKDMLKVK